MYSIGLTIVVLVFVFSGDAFGKITVYADDLEHRIVVVKGRECDVDGVVMMVM
jgi:hypothetical protein